MSENFKKLFKKKINKQARMIFSFQAAVFLAMLGYMIFKIIYLRSTTGLTDTIINELSGSFIESGIPIILGLFLGMIVVLFHRKSKLFTYDLLVQNRKMTLKKFLKLFLCFMFVQAIFTVGATGIENLFNLFGYTLMEGMESATETSIMFSMFIYASILGPITEEIVFRGALLRGLEKYGKLFAIIVSAVLFGAFHSNLIQGIFTTLAGLLLGYVAIEYSIKWAIVFHIINNLVLGDILGSILSYFSLGTQSIINYILLILAFFGGIFVLFKSWGSIKKYIRENKSDRTLYQYTFTSFWVVLYISINVLLSIFSITKII